MKYKTLKTFLFVIIFIILPTTTFAHSGSSSDVNGCSVSDSECDTSIGVMRSIEDRMLGDDLHEEMEGLMERMMDGNMSEAESERMIELLEEHPGANTMMMNRIGMTNNANIFKARTYGHMFGGGYGFVSWLFVLTTIIWLFVGLFALNWFIKKQK